MKSREDPGNGSGNEREDGKAAKRTDGEAGIHLRKFTAQIKEKEKYQFKRKGNELQHQLNNDLKRKLEATLLLANA